MFYLSPGSWEVPDEWTVSPLRAQCETPGPVSSPGALQRPAARWGHQLAGRRGPGGVPCRHLLPCPAPLRAQPVPRWASHPQALSTCSGPHSHPVLTGHSSRRGPLCRAHASLPWKLLLPTRGPKRWGPQRCRSPRWPGCSWRHGRPCSCWSLSSSSPSRPTVRPRSCGRSSTRSRH